jgi:hypothetical protein
MLLSRLAALVQAPRRSFTVRLSLIIGAVALIANLTQSAVFAFTSRSRLEKAVSIGVRDNAYQLSAQIERGMFERYREIQSLAALPEIERGARRPATTRALLEEL